MPPVIDAWIQHPTPDFLREPVLQTVRRWIRADAVPETIPPEMTKVALDAAGVDRAIITAWWGPRGPMLTNDHVAEMCQRFPGRLFGAACVDLYDPMGAVRELRRCVNELGFVAVRILPWLWGLPPNDRRYYPIYAACIDLDIPFCLQVGHAGPRMPSEPGRPIPYLDEVACDFPELKIVGGHIGYPWVEEMLSLCRKYENVHIDTSAYKPSRYPKALVEYMQRGGREKVLFGSNFPMIQPRAALDQLDSLGLDEEALSLFLHDNAARVFFGEEPDSAAPAAGPEA